MNSLHRLLGIFALVAAVGCADALFAQISIGGFSQGGTKNSQNQDDDDNNNNQNSNRQSNRRSQGNNQSDDDSNVEQFQQFFPGGQNGEGQKNSNQFRRSQQGQFQQGQFQNGQLPNNKQLQNWQQSNQNGLSIGVWQGGKWNGSHKVQNWTQTFGGNQTPFSDQWYNDHPKAWKYNNNKSNVWVVGTVPGLYGWLGWGNVPQQYNVNYGHQHHNYDDYGDWYPLGVYSLMSGPGDMGTRIVQLAIDRHGHINGNYYDMITNSNYSVSGDVSQQSQRVSWALNKNQFIRFRASIGQLLQPYGTITVKLPGGEQQWQFVRLEN